MKSIDMPIQVLRRELRASREDRTILTKLHSVITRNIKHVDDEEREILLEFSIEVTEAINRMTAGQAVQQVPAEMRRIHE